MPFSEARRPVSAEEATEWKEEAFLAKSGLEAGPNVELRAEKTLEGFCARRASRIMEVASVSSKGSSLLRFREFLHSSPLHWMEMRDKIAAHESEEFSLTMESTSEQKAAPKHSPWTESLHFN